MFGCMDLVIALVEGEDRAQSEQHQRDHKGVEESATPIPERVQAICFLTRGPLSVQQQTLVGRVRDRMHGLGQHR
ncbi:Uncharacterised protein [Mycobacteroides abscessus subsp. abscessus]|nr:Uncharacterised protein [Mycobacteroides abscessus subsp. abscessus]